MSPIRHRRSRALAALAATAALAGVLAGCGGGPGTPAGKAAAAVGLTTPADRLAAAIKMQATKQDLTTRMVARDATSTTNVNGGGQSGTLAQLGTVRLSGGNHDWIVVEGVKGYKAPSVSESMIVVDGGGVCTSVRGSDTNNTDVIVSVLASCPPDK